jgi:hypothetical protein
MWCHSVGCGMIVVPAKKTLWKLNSRLPLPASAATWFFQRDAFRIGSNQCYFRKSDDEQKPQVGPDFERVITKNFKKVLTRFWRFA